MDVHAVKFPLDTGRLPRVLLGAPTIRSLKETAEREISDVLEDPTSWYFRFIEFRDRYKESYDKNGIKGYSQKKPGTSTSVARFQSLSSSGSSLSKTSGGFNSVGEIHALCETHLTLTEKDVINALHCEDTHQLRILGSYLYDDQFLDAAVLWKDKTHTPDEHDPFRFAGITWFCVDSPALSSDGPRDLIEFRYHVRTFDNEGRRVLVRYVRPLELDLTQDRFKEHSLHIGRFHLSMMDVFREDKGQVVYRGCGILDCGDPKAMNLFFRSYQYIIPLSELRVLSAAGLLPTLAQQANSNRRKKSSKEIVKNAKDCNVCHKKLGGILRSNKKSVECLGCEHAVCGKCTVDVKFVSLSSKRCPGDGGYHSKHEKFCLRCIIQAREKLGKQAAGTFNPSSVFDVEKSPTAEENAWPTQEQWESHQRNVAVSRSLSGSNDQALEASVSSTSSAGSVTGGHSKLSLWMPASQGKKDSHQKRSYGKPENMAGTPRQHASDNTTSSTRVPSSVSLERGRSSSQLDATETSTSSLSKKTSSVEIDPKLNGLVATRKLSYESSDSVQDRLNQLTMSPTNKSSMQSSGTASPTNKTSILSSGATSPTSSRGGSSSSYGSDTFHKMNESIAAQEAMLNMLKKETQRYMGSSRGRVESRTTGDPMITHAVQESTMDRFEELD